MSFDRVAPFYGWLERLGAGGRMQQCRTMLLGEIVAPRKVLLAGEGPGKFLEECLRRFPDAEFTVLDASEEMLGRARRKVGSERVHFIHAVLPDWNAPLETFDLVVTNFFLDCFEPPELEAVIQILTRAATSDASWLVADFEIAPKGWQRWRSRFVVGVLYRFFGIVTGLKTTRLATPDDALKRAGFSRVKRVVTEHGLLKSEWWRRSH